MLGYHVAACSGYMCRQCMLACEAADLALHLGQMALDMSLLSLIHACRGCWCSQM